MELKVLSNTPVAKTDKGDAKAEPKVNLQTENDKVELSGKKKKNIVKKIAIGTAIYSLATATAALAIMIGRNPAKAAKVLKGNSDILEPAFKEGRDLMNKILAKEGKFVTTFDDILVLFKKPAKKSQLNESLDVLEEIMKKDGNKPSDDVLGAFNELKKNLEQYHKKIETDLLNGVEIKHQIREDFATQNESNAQKLMEYINNLKTKSIFGSEEYNNLSTLSYKFDNFSLKNTSYLNAFIKDCPKEALPADGIYYHGTLKPKEIYKKGFTPFASRQIEESARELGSGVYLSPDIYIAANYTGLRGPIIPTRIEKDAKIALVTEDVHRALHDKIHKFLNERYTKAEWSTIPKITQNATIEAFFNKVFKDAGYDAAYIPKGVHAGGGILGGLFNPNVNEVFGRNQSQLVVFNPEKLEIVPRTFKERVCDLKAKLGALKAQIKYQIEHPYGF